MLTVSSNCENTTKGVLIMEREKRRTEILIILLRLANAAALCLVQRLKYVSDLCLYKSVSIFLGI